MFLGFIAWLKHKLGLDRAILFTTMARGWSSFAGLVTVLLIARFLSPPEQGYYYTFGSLVALQIVFELGFSFVILQMASHECAHLNISPTGAISGEPTAHARLASVLQKTIQWYTIAAALLFLGLLPAGLYFFSIHTHPGQVVAWRMPWVLVSFAATLTFQIDPIFAFLEGCGYVPQVARTRLWQALAGSTLAWGALVTHHGLFAPALMILGQAIAGVFWLKNRRKLLLGLLRYPVGIHRIEWFKEVWPFQWRIAVSWISGYFIFQLFNPVLFAYRGAAAAGQMGMSLSISTAVMSIGIAWISTKAAPFGSLVARKDYKELDRVFFRALAQSWIICVATCFLVFAGRLYLEVHKIPFTHRLLPPWQFGILLLTVIVNHIVFSEAVYLRAHKEEKFLMVSILSAILTAASTYFLGRLYGAAGMVAGYFIISTVVGLGIGTAIFTKYRRLWHVQ
jgi:hypothetical protein